MRPTNAETLKRAESFERFLESLRDPDSAGPAFSPRRFADALQIDQQALAEQAGAHLNTLTHAPFSGGIQDFLRESIRVLRMATDLCDGDVDRALFWYRNEPMQIFQYQTPEQLVITKRGDDLLRYVMSLGAGPSG